MAVNYLLFINKQYTTWTLGLLNRLYKKMASKKPRLKEMAVIDCQFFDLLNLTGFKYRFFKCGLQTLLTSTDIYKGGYPKSDTGCAVSAVFKACPYLYPKESVEVIQRIPDFHIVR